MLLSHETVLTTNPTSAHTVSVLILHPINAQTQSIWSQIAVAKHIYKRVPVHPGMHPGDLLEKTGPIAGRAIFRRLGRVRANRPDP